MSPSTTSTHASATASSSALLTGEELERRLEELLHQDRFAPPTQFVAAESVNDASLHAWAERDPDAFWAEQARTLHWDEPFTTVLDDSNPPFYKWFVDGKLNVSYGCADRLVEAGRGNRVVFLAEQIGKLARPKRILWTDGLPKTRSGKIMRRLLRDIAEGRALGDATTLGAPTVMADLAQKISASEAQEG